MITRYACADGTEFPVTWQTEDDADSPGDGTKITGPDPRRRWRLPSIIPATPACAVPRMRRASSSPPFSTIRLRMGFCITG